MADNGILPRPDPSGSQSPRAENRATQRTGRSSLSEVNALRQHARRAEGAVLEARAEREEYRRVLAAAVANEKTALGQVEVVKLERDQLAGELRTAEFERGKSQGRALELEVRLQAVQVSNDKAERQQEIDNDRLRQEYERDLQSALLDRSEALGRVRELQSKLAGVKSPAGRALRARARAILAGATLCYLLALVFLPPLALSLVGSERATYMEMATGFSGWGLIGVVIAFFALGLALNGFGIRDLKAAEQQG